MRHDIGKLLGKLAVFAVPFALYAALVATTDPYEMFRVGGPIDHEDKLAVSYKLNYSLWKVLAYEKDPAGHILLGDSRVMALDEDDVAEATGAPVANLAYGGGSLREVIDTFWLVAERHDLERVSIGLGFSLYNAANDKNRVAEVESILDNPLLYFTNLNVIDAMAKLVRAAVTGETPVIGKPPMDPDEFWVHQLDTVTRVYYESWRPPLAYRSDLAAIAEYCGAHGIRLEFFVPPGHADLQATVAEHGLEDEYAGFKSDLADLGVVYDFDYLNEFTGDRSNYRDPYHLTEEAEHQIVDGVWGAGSPHVRVVDPSGSPQKPNGD